MIWDSINLVSEPTDPTLWVWPVRKTELGTNGCEEKMSSIHVIEVAIHHILIAISEAQNGGDLTVHLCLTNFGINGDEYCVTNLFADSMVPPHPVRPPDFLCNWKDPPWRHKIVFALAVDPSLKEEMQSYEFLEKEKQFEVVEEGLIVGAEREDELWRLGMAAAVLGNEVNLIRVGDKVQRDMWAELDVGCIWILYSPSFIKMRHDRGSLRIAWALELKTYKWAQSGDTIFLHDEKQTQASHTESFQGRGDEVSAVEQPTEAFTNIFFSSGTIGGSKAIPWTNATPLKAAAEAWCHMDIHKGDVAAWPTNLGWMMGLRLVYASLLNGAPIALYTGSPLGSGFAKFVQDAKVTMLGVIPSIVQTWKSLNNTSGYDWFTICCFALTNEASSVDACMWLLGRANYKPIIEYCGGTNIDSGFVTGSLLQPQSLTALSTPSTGCRLFTLDDGHPLPPNVLGIGELALDPVMFGSSSTLLNADHDIVYFKGMPSHNGKTLRRHGNYFKRTSSGYYRAHGRADDTMNLGGIKASSVEIESICNAVDTNVRMSVVFYQFVCSVWYPP